MKILSRRYLIALMMTKRLLLTLLRVVPHPSLLMHFMRNSSIWNYLSKESFNPLFRLGHNQRYALSPQSRLKANPLPPTSLHTIRLSKGPLIAVYLARTLASVKAVVLRAILHTMSSILIDSSQHYFLNCKPVFDFSL